MKNPEIVQKIRRLEETVFINPSKLPESEAERGCPLTMRDIEDADERLRRFAPYLAEAFPETAPSGGIIESPLREISAMQAELDREYDCRIPGKLYVKLDSHLPISGSIKARGGIYEVLKTADRKSVV